MPPKHRIEADKLVGGQIYENEQEYRDCVYNFYVIVGFYALTRTALKRVLKAYLPDSIFEQLDLSFLAVSEPMDLEIIGHNAEVHIEDVFEGSYELLEIYGSSEELVSNLRKFCSFTNSFEELWEPYRNCIDYVFLGIPEIYDPIRVLQRNVGREPFMTKQEAYIFLRDHVIRDILTGFADELPCLMLTLFLKYKQRENVDSKFELVTVKHKEFAKMVEQINAGIESFRERDQYKKNKKRVKKLVGSNKDATIEAFEDLLVQFKVADDQTIGALRRYFDTEPPKNGTYPFAYMHKKLSEVFTWINSMITAHPSIFSDKPATTFVRVFEYGKKRFAIEGEVMKAAGRECRVEPIPPGYWKTLPSSEVAGKLGSQFTSTELMSTRLFRTDHRALPVYGPDGKLCKLAIDVFLEVLDDLIFGLRVFDSKVENSKQRVMDFLNGLPDVMDMTEKNMYFICEKRYVEINQKVQETFADFKGAETEIEFAEIDLEADDYTSTAVDALKMLNIADEFTEEEIKKAALIASPDGDDSNEKAYSTTDSIRMMCKAIKIMLSEKNGTIRAFMDNHNGFHRLLGMDLDGLYAKKVAIKKEKEADATGGEPDDKDSSMVTHSSPLPSPSKIEEKPEEEESNREELPEDSSAATHSSPQNNALEVVELSGPSDDKDMIPEQKKEVNNKRILTVDGPVLEGLSSEERELIKRAQDEWKSMKATLKDLDKKKISDNSRLERLRAEIAERKARMNDLVTSKNATIEKLNDEKKMLEEKKKELELKLKMTPITRDVFDEIQEGIKTDKIQERVDEMSVSVRKMRDAFVKEMDKFEETLNEHSKIIEKNPELYPPTDLLPDVPLPEVTLEFVKSHLENSDNV